MLRCLCSLSVAAWAGWTASGVRELRFAFSSFSAYLLLDLVWSPYSVCLVSPWHAISRAGALLKNFKFVNLFHIKVSVPVLQELSEAVHLTPGC